MRDGKLEFTDAAMFRRVMSDESICRRVLETILNIEIERIEYSHAEHVVEPGLTARGIRADVYVKSDDTVFDIEMQSTRGFSLGKRLRYYQGAMDVSALRKGAAYEELPQSMIIFICAYDPFDADIPVYSFDMSCKNEPSLRIGHGFEWLVLNAKAFAKLHEGPLRDLLEYVASGRAESPASLTADIRSAVEQANIDEEWRRIAMDVYTIEEDLASKSNWLDKIKEQLEEENERLEERKEQLEEENERLEERKQQFEERKEQLEEENEQLEEKKVQLEEKEEQLDKEKESLDKKEVQLDKKEEQLDKERESLDKKEEQLREKEAQLKELEEALAARERAMGQH